MGLRSRDEAVAPRDGHWIPPVGPLRYRGGVPGRRATEHQEAGLLESWDLSVWMIEALTHMSAVETVAL